MIKKLFKNNKLIKFNNYYRNIKIILNWEVKALIIFKINTETKIVIIIEIKCNKI